MQNNPQIDPALDELASALGGLQPDAPAADCDRMMFRLGEATGRRRVRRQQWVSTVAAGVCGLLLALPAAEWLHRPAAVPSSIVDVGQPNDSDDTAARKNQSPSNEPGPQPTYEPQSPQRPWLALASSRSPRS